MHQKTVTFNNLVNYKADETYFINAFKRSLAESIINSNRFEPYKKCKLLYERNR